MINPNEPVKGYDLDELRRTLGLAVDDMRWLLGLTINRWGEYTKTKPDSPVPPTVALLVRYYDQHPGECPIPTPPSAHELHAKLGGTLKEVGIILGRESVSGFRWVKQGGRMSPSVRRLAFHLSKEIDEGGLDEWRDLVETEARARGLSDIWRNGVWVTPEERAQRRSRRSHQKSTDDEDADTIDS